MIKLNDKSNFTIRNSYEMPIKNKRQEFEIKQFSSVRIDHKGKVKFKKILRDILHFQNLLTLFIQYSPTPNSVELYFKEGKKQDLHKVEVFYSLIKPQRVKEKIHWSDMLIPYKLIKEDFSQIVIEWMNEKDNMSNILNPFFSTFHSPFFYVSDKFLNLAKSMEAFHRDRVNSSRNIFFIDRIEKVLKDYSRLYNGLTKIRSKRVFAERVKNMRNLFTHSNQIEDKVDKDNMQLYRMSSTLQLIMTCALLNEFGVKKSLIRNQVEKTNIFIHLEK